ncbi:MAG: UvrD-helicase domain-containing protein [Candidatus Azobacteroides sp.]|nr:UvrD-helicase domain-containing protein [Candidatus Azobacteroides sp.]
MELLDQLNENQRQAVEYIDGPSLVIAGAGSGKTRVLTYKIAYLLQKGLSPYSILALTFTNKAAREMKDRIGAMVGEQLSRRLWMGTFHSIFARILRTEAERIGYKKDFTIYDTADSKSLIKTILKGMGLDEKIYKPATVLGRISGAKNALISPQAYAADKALIEYDQHSKMPLLRDIYTSYQARCFHAGAMDFDDLLFYTNVLFRDNPDVLEKYRNHFQYILVDEYQDTNFSQHLIIKQLAQGHGRICVVGDDAQSIYSFRGANIDNILHFKSQFSGCRVFTLNRNYRSTQNIVNAANSLIDKNKQQIKKTVFSENEEGEKIEIISSYSDIEESNIVANKLHDLRFLKQYQYKDFAVLYRTNAQSRVFEEALRKRNIPYRIYGGLSFYQRKEIKDVIAYLRLIVNNSDEEAFKRIINYPVRGIGNTSLTKITEAADRFGISLWEAAFNPLEYNTGITGKAATSLTQFKAMMDGFIERRNTDPAYDLAYDVIRETGIAKEFVQDKTPENLSRQENLQELLAGIHEFCTERIEEGDEFPTISNFLSQVSLMTDQDTDKNADTDKVTLMTVHAAKGLEFKNVFVVGLEEGLFPSFRSESERDIEEERRLFYVAITRAEDHCIITFAKSRFRNGQSELTNPSRFLKDIDKSFLKVSTPELLEDAPFSRKFQGSKMFQSGRRDDWGLRNESVGIPKFKKESPLFKESAGVTLSSNHKPLSALKNKPGESAGEDIQIGDIVQHDRFGVGEVKEIIVVDADTTKASISFAHSGDKTLLLKFAKLSILKKRNG